MRKKIEECTGWNEVRTMLDHLAESMRVTAGDGATTNKKAIVDQAVDVMQRAYERQPVWKSDDLAFGFAFIVYIIGLGAAFNEELGTDVNDDE